MTNTRFKLEEAKYFLKRLADEVATCEPFKYNLSAFLSAGRSVTFVMQTEFSSVPEFKEWYDEKQKELNSDPLMKLMNDKRRVTIHQKPIQPRSKIDVFLKSTITITDHLVEILHHKNGTYERFESNEKTPPIPKKEKTAEVRYHWYFEDIADEDILTLSQTYIAKLELLVNECESRFAQRKANK
ncbi:MAG: hypothetical protein ABIL69_08400 [candidate division WOR-3 bacterium]